MSVSQDRFQSPYGDFGNVTFLLISAFVAVTGLFQSPYGDFDNATFKTRTAIAEEEAQVSVPLRGF